MKKFYFVMVLLIAASFVLTACGSGCKTGDTEQQCRDRSPIEKPIAEADEASDEVIKTLNQQIDADTKLRDAAIQQHAIEQDKKIQEVNEVYTDWVTKFAESILGPIP